MPKIVGAREVVHQPIYFDLGRGAVWGGPGGMVVGGMRAGLGTEPARPRAPGASITAWNVIYSLAVLGFGIGLGGGVLYALWSIARRPEQRA